MPSSTRMFAPRVVGRVTLALGVSVLSLAFASSARAALITEFSAGITPGSGPTGIAAGPDGNIWFTESSAIGRITPAGVVTEFRTGLTPDSNPHDIVAGPDGNMWFTERSQQAIGRITLGGTITEFTTGISGNTEQITRGVDGNLWFTEQAAVGRITPGGTVTEYPLVGFPEGIAATGDGSIWFTELSMSSIGLLNPEPSVPAAFFSTGIKPGAQPYDLTIGPDGNLWFTEHNNAAIGRFRYGFGTTEFPLAVAPGQHLQGIAAGSDGNLWITEFQNSVIHRMNISGGVTNFAQGITPGRSPFGIAPGPDGNVWFTEDDGVGRIIPITPPGAATGVVSAITRTTAHVTGAVNPNTEPTTYRFEFGTTTRYGASSAAVGVGAGTATLPATADLTGLTPGTTYHYRLVATNGDGSNAGADATFTTRKAPTAILSPITVKWVPRKGGYTTNSQFVVRNVPSDGQVRLTCRGRGCPFKVKTVKHGGTVRLTKAFRRKGHAAKLRPRTTVEVRVTAPDRIGRLQRYKMRRLKLPAFTLLCLPPDAKSPQKCT